MNAFQKIKSELHVRGSLHFVCRVPLKRDDFFYAPLHAMLQRQDQPFIAHGPLAFSNTACLRGLLEKVCFLEIEIAKTSIIVYTKDGPEENTKLLMQIDFAR